MIIFLYGVDIYRSRQKLNEIIEHYKKIHKSTLNLRYFEEENLNFQDFKNEIETISIFQEKKFVILKDIFFNLIFKEEFLKQKEKFIKINDIILIYEKKEISQKDPLFQFLKKNSKSQEFIFLEGQKLKNWVKKEFNKYQATVDFKAIDKLINFTGNNLWQLSNEIKKLASYKNNQKVEVEDIELLVKPKVEIDIFKTIDVIALKDKKRALFLIHRHLEKGDNPLYLFSMINFQFRNLLIIKDLIEKNRPFYTFAQKTKLHPYVIKKSYSQAQKFTISELKEIYQKFFQIDIDIKTGKLDPQIALELFIVQI
jgi:DNA polymerase-3 subunit delta